MEKLSLYWHMKKCSFAEITVLSRHTTHGSQSSTHSEMATGLDDGGQFTTLATAVPGEAPQVKFWVELWVDLRTILIVVAIGQYRLHRTHFLIKLRHVRSVYQQHATSHQDQYFLGRNMVYTYRKLPTFRTARYLYHQSGFSGNAV